MYPATEKIHIKLTIEGSEVEGAFELPAGTAPRRVVLPILRQLTDVVISLAETRVREQGQSISCQKGCDACCRQLVPISTTEAFDLANLLANMPEDQRARIEHRFAEALASLQSNGLLERLRRRDQLNPTAQHTLDVDYFDAAIPCPFLEDSACSIHTHRPLICREFLVTSPAEFCQYPTADRVHQVHIGTSLSAALQQSERVAGEPPWLPLVLCLEHTQAVNEKSGQPAQILRDVLKHL